MRQSFIYRVRYATQCPIYDTFIPIVSDFEHSGDFCRISDMTVRYIGAQKCTSVHQCMQQCTANYICEDVVARGEVFEMNAQIKKQEGVTPKEATPSGRYAQPTTIPSQPDTLAGRLSGYAYDLMRVRDTIAHVEALTGTDLSQYHDNLVATKTQTPIVNVSVPNWQFIAIGFNAKSVRFPVLARNKVTHEWVYADAVVWYEKEGGFVWSSGCYTGEKHARQQFEKDTNGNVVFYTEAY